MAHSVNKISIIIYFVYLTNNAAESKHRSTSSSSDNSDSLEMERIERRNMLQNEWQYEGGIPIEDTLHQVEGRRHNNEDALEEQAAPITSTAAPSPDTPPTLATPPADRRYRRIYNPDEVAVIEDYKFMAAVLVNNQLWCGGAIIASDKVLTAAHCLQLQFNNRFFREYVKMLSVRVGSDNATAGGELLQVLEIFFHPNYKPQSLEFNFAVLKLHKNLTFDRSGHKVDMIDYSREKTIPINNQILFLGWGSVFGVGGRGGDVLLQKVELPIYDLADCQEIYGRDLVTRTNFCAGYITVPKNVCNHDAGGPAIMNGVLVGILSFSSKRCDENDKPAVFSSVGAAAPWIDKVGESKLQIGNTILKSH